MKPAHYRGDYQARAKRVRDAANADPTTKCWRCGHVLARHPNTKTGKPPQWTAGHTRDGDPTSPLLPEVDVCNFSAGAHRTNQLRANPRSKKWLA